MPYLIATNRSISFKEANERIRAGAAAFQKLGVLPGSCVSVFAENSCKWFITEQSGTRIKPSRSTS